MSYRASVSAVLALAAVGAVALPHAANAWWRGGVGVWVPPVVVGPPPVIYGPPAVAYVPPPPPGYYPPPRRIWIPPHREGPYWVRGHWS
jgi:hypothetical protein